jgi:hypothetical protein
MIKKLGAWGIGPMVSGATGPAWMRPFQFAADFRSGFVRLGGRRVSMETIDGYHTRASERRAVNSAGISLPFANGAMARTDLGYDSREGWINLVGAADFATATLGVIGAGGSLPGWSATGVATAGLTTEVVELLTYRGLPAARVRVYGVWNGTFWELRPGEQQGLTEGVTYTSSMVIAERQCPGPGAPQLEVSWRSAPSSAYVSGILVSTPSQFISPATPDLQSASLVCPAGASRVRLRLISGGSSGWVAGNFIDFTCVLAAPQVTATPYLMPFGSNTVAPDALFIPASAAGLAVNPSVTGLTMVWRGIDYQSAPPFVHFVDIRADGNNRFTLFRRLSDGGVGSTVGSNGPTSGPGLGTLAQLPRGTEFTMVATWRPDGAVWVKAGSVSPGTITRPMMVGTPAGIGIACNGANGQDRLNSQTRIAGIGGFALSDADALNLFNAVAAA